METDKKKTGYQSQWQEQLRDIAGKIINREPFSYDLNGDALYKQYKDRYIQQGKQAMMDTMGQAATHTGGYGNSYAQTVGQQTYQGYLQGLNDQMPTLYGLALDTYNSEGDRLRGNLNVLMQRDDVDYDRYRDGIADRDDAYSKLMALMTGYGYVPTPEELEAAGMTEAQMRAILGIKDGTGGTGGGGGTGGKKAVYNLDDLTPAGKNWLERNAYFHDENILKGSKGKALLEQQLDTSGLGAEDKRLIAGKYGVRLD